MGSSFYTRQPAVHDPPVDAPPTFPDPDPDPGRAGEPWNVMEMAKLDPTQPTRTKDTVRYATYAGPGLAHNQQPD